MTEIGQIKKEKANFGTIRMSKPGHGQGRDAPPQGGIMIH
jgi:hypothetical protein